MCWQNLASLPVWDAFILRSGIRARIASVLRAAVPANHRSGRKTARTKVVLEELIFADEIHDLLRWSDWVRAYRARRHISSLSDARIVR